MSANRNGRGRVGVWAAAGLLATGTLVGALTTGGCNRGANAPMSNPPEPANGLNHTQAAVVEVDVERRAEELKARSRQFADVVRMLPRANDEEDRDTLRQAFTQLAQILPSLPGPDVTGVFQHQVSVVNDARTQLAGRSDLAVDPIVDTGLRATRNALVEAAHTSYYEEARAQLDPALDQLTARVDDLDKFTGPVHPVAVAAALQQAGQVIGHMSDALTA